MKKIESGRVYKLDILPTDIPNSKREELKKIIIAVMAKICGEFPVITMENWKDHVVYKWYEEIMGIPPKDIHVLTAYIQKPQSIIDESIRQFEFPDLSKWKSPEGTRLTKQLGKWFHFFWKYKLTNEESTKMGTILTITLTSTIWFRILNPREEPVWLAGEYADANSCFWQSRTDARLTIEQNPKYTAMLFFKKEPPADKLKDHNWLNNNDYTLGRCWLFEREKGGFVMFNGYFKDSKFQLNNIHASMSELLETKSDRIVLVNRGSTRDRLWVNEEGHGYLIADDADKIGSIDMNMDTYKIKCSKCEKTLTENEMDRVRAITVDGVQMTLCPSCRNMAKRCSYSDEWSFEEYNVFGSDLNSPNVLVLGKHIEKALQHKRIIFIERYNIYSTPDMVYSCFDWKTNSSKMERYEDVVFSRQLQKNIPRPDSALIYDAKGITWIPKAKIEKEKKDAETKSVGTSVPSTRRTVSRSV